MEGGESLAKFLLQERGRLKCMVFRRKIMKHEAKRTISEIVLNSRKIWRWDCKRLNIRLYSRDSYSHFLPWTLLLPSPSGQRPAYLVLHLRPEKCKNYLVLLCLSSYLRKHAKFSKTAPFGTIFQSFAPPQAETCNYSSPHRETPFN